MVKKAKIKKNKKNIKKYINKKDNNINNINNLRNKISLELSNTVSIPKGLNLTDIEIKIIKHVKNNISNLHYYNSDLNFVKLNSKTIEKVKSSCLCRISDEFGTAVCISDKGYILTCSHAVPPYEDDKTKECLYIFLNGEIVKTITLEKDGQLDLALLKITEVLINEKFVKIEKIFEKKFIYSKIKSAQNQKNEKIGTKVFCIGNPCFEMYDDEGKLKKNNYKPFCISFGKIKGYSRDGIYCKNDLGPLIHDCWTYWGHSGAPIFNYNGEIVGMHNSWNEKNANRHGNSLLGINKFVSKFYFL